MTQGFRHPLSRAEFWSLVGLLFFLPMVEAPKNLFWLAFVSIWFVRATRDASWGGGWRNTVDLPFVAMLAAAGISCLNAAPFPANWHEYGDIVRYIALGWLLARSRLSERQLLLALSALLIGTLITALYGWWRWRIAGLDQWFEFHSVGHTNHSAIFLAITALINLGILMVLWRRLTTPWRALLLLSWLLQTWLLATGESRGAMLAYSAGLGTLGLTISSRRGRWLMLSGGVIVVAVMLAHNPNLLDKTRLQLTDPERSSSSYRLELARTSLEAFRQHPLTGIGPHNFRLANVDQVRTWLEARGATYAPEKFFHSSHAHNLYFNTLAERGLLGLAALAMLAVMWVRALVKAYTSKGQERSSMHLLGAIGLAGFCGVFVAGIFNTSLHHEHGLLAMFSFGLLLSAHETDNG